MATTPQQTSEIEAFITANVDKHPDDIARMTAEHFGITRQAVHRHLARLVKEKKLAATGSTRNRRYTSALLADIEVELELTPELEEDRVWDKYIAPHVRDIPTHIRGICFYGFTEMLNNAKDHSESSHVTIRLRRSPNGVRLAIFDKGVGIFHKIATTLHLEDERHAVLELSKGKLTTDPKRHSGEGIFFTSKMFDDFFIFSGPWRLVCNQGQSWLFDTNDRWVDTDQGPIEGTHVHMWIDTSTQRTSEEVFDRFAGQDQDYGFTHTHVPVALARHGTENLVSRSQAKRLLARFERFKEVVLDFQDVPMIGQAFADEVFRVFQNQHPDIRLSSRNAVPEVERMIRRAIAKSKEDAGT